MKPTNNDSHKFREAVCIGCACRDLSACIDTKTGRPCHWKRLDAEAGLGVCSSCPQTLERWDNGYRTPVVVDAERYRWLRERDLDTIDQGGVFAGQTPENVLLNGEDLDQYIDAAMGQSDNQQGDDHGY